MNGAGREHGAREIMTSLQLLVGVIVSQQTTLYILSAANTNVIPPTNVTYVTRVTSSNVIQFTCKYYNACKCCKINEDLGAANVTHYMATANITT